MLDYLKDYLGDMADTVIRPRIEKAKTDLHLAVITGTVILVFSLLALLCLYVVVFIHLSKTMDDESAALALFGFSLFMCLGAVLMFIIGKRVEQKLYERRMERPLREIESAGPDVGAYMHDLFADNKGAALIAASVAGIVMGAKPGMVLKGLAKIVKGGAKQQMRRRR